MVLETIVEAIADRRIITFKCDGKTFTGEPHLAGIDRNGDLVVHLWRTGAEGEAWHTCVCRNLSDLAVLDATFPGRCRSFSEESVNLIWTLAKA